MRELFTKKEHYKGYDYSVCVYTNTIQSDKAVWAIVNISYYDELGENILNQKMDLLLNPSYDNDYDPFQSIEKQTFDTIDEIILNKEIVAKFIDLLLEKNYEKFNNDEK